MAANRQRSRRSGATAPGESGRLAAWSDSDLAAQHRVPAGGKGFHLRDIDPRDKRALSDRAKAEAAMAVDIARIDSLQDKLYAEHRRALLCVFQAMDCGGKDGTIKKVFGPAHPLGLIVTNFKRPTVTELAQDYLWRIHKAMPGRGMIGLFNRSHYEDVLAVRVHKLVPAADVERRYDQINAFEKHLTENGVTILKFYLHISKAEQRRRLQERIDDPTKRWKFDPADVAERKHWHKYMAAYQIALERCSTPWAPRYVIPADRNWNRNAVVARIVRSTLDDLDPKYPKPDFVPSKVVVK